MSKVLNKAAAGDASAATLPAELKAITGQPGEGETVGTFEPAIGTETDLAVAPAVVGYVVRCHRDRGVWRAGRFWPPESTPVAASDLTADQLEALSTEPLLSVLPVQE